MTLESIKGNGNKKEFMEKISSPDFMRLLQIGGYDQIVDELNKLLESHYHDKTISDILDAEINLANGKAIQVKSLIAENLLFKGLFAHLDDSEIVGPMQLLAPVLGDNAMDIILIQKVYDEYIKAPDPEFIILESVPASPASSMVSCLYDVMHRTEDVQKVLFQPSPKKVDGEYSIPSPNSIVQRWAKNLEMPETREVEYSSFSDILGIPHSASASPVKSYTGTNVLDITFQSQYGSQFDLEDHLTKRELESDIIDLDYNSEDEGSEEDYHFPHKSPLKRGVPLQDLTNKYFAARKTHEADEHKSGTVLGEGGITFEIYADSDF